MCVCVLPALALGLTPTLPYYEKVCPQFSMAHCHPEVNLLLQYPRYIASVVDVLTDLIYLDRTCKMPSTDATWPSGKVKL